MQVHKVVVVVLLAAACCTARTGSDATSPPAADSRAGRHADLAGSGDATRGGPIRFVSNTSYLPTVLSMIEDAKQTIRVIHFECNQDETVDRIIAALVAAAGRGVDVAAMFEADVEDNAARVRYLKSEGVQARLDGDERYTHAKLVVADGRRVLLGSTNWSFMSMDNNNETDIYLDSDVAGAYFKSYAESLHADPAATPSLPETAIPALHVKRLLHDGDYFDAVHPLLQNATRRILLLIYAIHLNPQYPDSDIHKLVAALAAAKQRGLEVRVILEASNYNRDMNELNKTAAATLAADCVPVRFDPLDQISHAKLVIVDDTVVIESNNWGHGGLHLYHEVGCITDHPDVLADANAYFESVWSESSLAAPLCK